MKKYAIIVAGGSGTRMKSEVPKQFLLLNNKPVLFHTLENFSGYSIILVLPEKQIALWKNLCLKNNFRIPHQIVKGGKERFHSVKNGLAKVPENSVVAVHDGVRPLVSKEVIKRCFQTAEKKGTAVPVIPLSESLRQKKNKTNVSVDRKDFFLVQTPQCFRSAILKKAYRHKFLSTFTDDASVVEKSGVKIELVEGNLENIKITTPADLKIAEALLKCYSL